MVFHPFVFINCNIKGGFIMVCPCLCIGCKKRNHGEELPQRPQDEVFSGGGVPRPFPAQQPYGQGADQGNVREAEGQVYP